MEWMSKLGEERDYKDEYKKFQSSTKSKKYRAELNKYNRKKGTYGNGDGKDASHKGGKIVGFEKESKNRGRAEKSRLKKENDMPDFTPIIDEAIDGLITEGAKDSGQSRFFESKVVNEKVLKKNPGEFVASTFSKAIDKLPNSKLTKDLVIKLAKKYKVDKDDALRFVSYGYLRDFGLKESVNEKMGPEQYHKYMQYVFDTQFKTPEEKKMKKSIIKKINVAQKKKGLPVFKESVNEGDKKEYKNLYVNMEKAYEKFAREVVHLANASVKLVGGQTDKKIIIKHFHKHVLEFMKLMMSWNKGHQSNPHIDESPND